MKMRKFYLMRLLLFSIVLLGISFYSSINAKAYVGQRLPKPESGWTRYDDTDESIHYIGDKSSWIRDNDFSISKFYKGTRTFERYEKQTYIEFTAKSTSIRIIGFCCGDNYKVYGDNKFIGTLKNQYLKDDPNRVMFEYTFDTLSEHKIRIVCDKYGSKYPGYDAFISLDCIDITTAESKVDSKFNPVLQVEQPVIGKVYTETLPISGYALNQSGVKSVTTTIDGQLKHNCNIGEKRNDAGSISSKYPGYPNTANSGYSASYQLKDIAIGWHTLVVEATGNDGAKVSKTLYLYVWENGQTKTVEVKPEEQKNQLIPLYRYCIKNTSTHFYTTSDQEVANGKYGYATQVSGTLPLYSYKRSDGVYFYTCNWNELKNGALDYTYQGIEGYMKTSK